MSLSSKTHTRQTVRSSLERSIAVGLSLACVTLIVIGIVQYRTMLAMIDTAHWVSHTNEVLAEIKTSMFDLQAAESAARGFALTGETEDLNKFKASLADTYQHERYLRSLTRDNPRQQQRLVFFEQLLNQRFARLNDVIEARRTAGIQAAVGITASSATREIISSINSVDRELENEERVLLEQRTEAARASALHALQIVVLGTVSGLLMVGIAGLIIHRHMLARRRVEREALHEKHLLTVLMDNSPASIFFKDLQSRFTRVNKATARWFGVNDPAEVIGKTDADFFSPEHAQKALADEQQILRTGRGMTSEEERETWRDRPDTWVWTSKLPLYDADGNLCGTFGVSRDITPRKLSERALEEANANLTRWVGELESRDRESVLLTEMNELLQTCMSEEEAQSLVSNFARDLFPQKSGALCLIKSSRNLVETVAHWGDIPSSETLFAPDQCWALRRGRLHAVAPNDVTPTCAHVRSDFTGAYMCVPMMAHGEALGMLHLSSQAAGSSDEDLKLRSLAATFAERVGLALANLRLREALRAQSIRDPLTGLFNRRYMEESLERELRRAERNNKPVAAIMIDLDHFKRFNDTFGHDAGDTLLHEFGGLLRARTRKEDIACRYGGEEFLLILPEAAIEDAYRRAEELREGVKHLDLGPARKAASVTASMGIALFPDHAQNANALLRAADSALYEAKSSGRDRVVLGNEIYA